ncbi:hypothetical protein CDO52_14970 [Nocardiopsis gilva YIM 90087]|uniref:ABC transporter permease n=1 Tax=Nocardiopsis gilva YIM 90087 TaxID=1235441 RepID=A0A223S762_9ACTN|nr:hypothetical protein CDO52_14970 [Nocardiopsis gilva YIM 90087]
MVREHVAWRVWVLIGAVGALAATAAVALLVGEFPAPWRGVAKALGEPGAAPQSVDFIIWEVRVPRLLAGAASGAAFGVAAALLQTAWGTPLAGPRTAGMGGAAMLAIVLAPGCRAEPRGRWAPRPPEPSGRQRRALAWVWPCDGGGERGHAAARHRTAGRDGARRAVHGCRAVCCGERGRRGRGAAGGPARRGLPAAGSGARPGAQRAVRGRGTAGGRSGVAGTGRGRGGSVERADGGRVPGRASRGGGGGPGGADGPGRACRGRGGLVGDVGTPGVDGVAGRASGGVRRARRRPCGALGQRA